jgi:hypothetical protein
VAKEDLVRRIEPVGAGLAHQGDRPIAVIAQFIVGTRQYCYSVIQVFASISWTEFPRLQSLQQCAFARAGQTPDSLGGSHAQFWRIGYIASMNMTGPAHDSFKSNATDSADETSLDI